jgi:GNAT superfamily N-acetyltransferase
MDLKIAERVRQGWRAELGAPAAFRRPGRHVHVRSEQDPARAGWVGVVTLWDSTCVSLPPSAPGWLHDLRRCDLDADLTEPAVVATVIGPVEGFLGPATLAFLDPAAMHARDDPQVASVPAGHQSVRQLAAACGPQDTQESGLVAVDSPVAVWWAAGQVVAASGYQVWHDQLAHLSVLVHPAHRGRGFGTAVAARAVGHAVDAGLVPQWRARWTLLASRQIARSLGLWSWPAGHLQACLATLTGQRRRRQPRPLGPHRRRWCGCQKVGRGC